MPPGHLNQSITRCIRISTSVHELLPVPQGVKLRHKEPVSCQFPRVWAYTDTAAARLSRHPEPECRAEGYFVALQILPEGPVRLAGRDHLRTYILPEVRMTGYALALNREVLTS